MSDTYSSTLPTINKRFKQGGLKTFIVGKITELNPNIPEHVFNWNDFDIELIVHMGSEEYLSQNKTTFNIKMKDDENVRARYNKMRVTIPELISITSDNLYLNDILDEYGFNKVFHPSLMNDMVTLLKNKLKLGNSVVIDDRLNDLGYKHIYVQFNENDNYTDMSYKFIIEDNVVDESNNGLIPSTDYFSSLLSIKDMNNDELGSHGYIIRFKEQENTESDSSGLSGPVVPPITAPISAPPLSPAPEDGEDADSVDF